MFHADCKSADLTDDVGSRLVLTPSGYRMDCTYIVVVDGPTGETAAFTLDSESLLALRDACDLRLRQILEDRP